MPEESKDNAPIKSTHLMMTILRFVGPFKGLLVFSIVLNTVFSALNAISIGLVKPVFTIIFNVDAQKSAPSKNFLDQLENNFYAFVESIIKSDSGIQQTLLNLGFLIVFMFVVKNVFKYWSSVTTTRLEESIVKSIRDKVFSNMTSLSVDYFTKSREGTLISIISNDVQVLNSSTIASFSIVLREFTQVVLFLVLLLGISIKLTLIAFSTSIISLLLIRFAMKYLRRYASRMQTAMADYTTTMQETIAGIRVVKAYNAESTVNRKFFENTKKYVRSAIKHQKIITLIPSINEVFAILALCVVLLVGAGEVLAGSMKSDELMAFLFFLFAIMSPIATIINSISQFQRGLVAASRVNSILEQKSTVETGIDPIAGFAGEIEFRNVSFAYKDAPVLRNVSFKIPKSSRIAFVGPSGSGKSTALDLLIRFYDPTEGEILIDGRNIREYRTDAYRSLFGIVGQESWLFNETIGNNISFGREGNTSEEAVSSASKLANAFNFITRLPDSFKTSIGDRGVMLSGGERQRISIARALLRNPQILVFDEATSSLDAESEKIVQEAIVESLKDRTAVLVAHRLATIIDCDMIYVFDQGRIVEFGSHDELMNRQGTYRRLYDLQFSRKDGE